MTSEQIRDIAQGMLRTRLVDWRGIVATLDAAERQALANEFLAITQQAARAASYTQWLGDVCDPDNIPDGQHANAVRASNQTVKVIRKALGYTYPDQPANF